MKGRGRDRGEGRGREGEAEEGSDVSRNQEGNVCNVFFIYV